MNNARETPHRSLERQDSELPSRARKRASPLFARRWVKIAFFGLCLGFFVAFGLLSVGRPASLEHQYDARYCYDAGLAWLDGRSGYETKSFGNPPHIAPLCTFLALLPWNEAQLAITLINLFCVGAIVYLSLRLLRETESPSLRLQGSGAEWYIAGILIGNPFVAKTIWMGQMSAIVGAAMLGCWYCYRRGHWLWSGILLAIATIKPQLSILVVMWFLLEGCWRILGAAAVTVLLLALVPLTVSGPFHLFPDWIAALAAYKSAPENSLGWVGQAGLQNSIYLLTGVEVPGLFLIAAILALALWVWRSQFLLNDIFGVLPLLSLLFGYGHYHDGVALSLCVPLFWRHLREPSPAKFATLALFALLLGTFAHSALHPPYEVFKMMLACRAFILLALGGVLLAMSHERVKSFRRAEQLANREFHLGRE